MTSLDESYLAGHGFDITTPGLKTHYRSATLATVLPGPVNMRACMYICARAQNVCVPEHACMMDGWTEDGEMGGFKCVHVCVHVTLPACV